MSSTATAPGPVPVEETQNKKEAGKSKPTRTLPTERINVSKQLDILRAYAAASNNGSRAASVNEVAEIVKMAATTVSIANAFLASVGLIQRTDAGSYMPSGEVINFLRAYEWNPETASHKLGPVLKDAWFGQALMSRITFGPMEEDTAITLLAEQSAAAPEYRKELKQIIEFMIAGGVIAREGTMLRAVKPAPAGEAVASSPVARQEETPVAQKPGKTVSTQLNSTAGGVTFNVDVSVDMAEFSTWRPERIQAFFRGIAEVLAAKADVEKSGGSV